MPDEPTEPSQRFKQFFALVARWECEFASGHYGDYNYVITEDDPDDSGGRTKYGVDQRSFPQVNIDKLTYADAERLYWQKCWVACRCEEMPLGIGEIVCDVAINCGNGQAIKLLQTTVDTKVDGWIGPKTIAAANLLPSHVEIQKLYQGRKAFYALIALKNGKLRKFLNGWNNRNAAVALYANKIVGGDIDFDKQYA